MRYHIFITDFDGTLANHGVVSASTLEKLQALKKTGRRLVLITGRILKDLFDTFPGYAVFDDIVAENGAVWYDVLHGVEKLLGPPADPAFVQLLQENGVEPLAVGKVIFATWEPHELAVLKAIKSSGSERQLIFNKGAVMILPPGINKASGMKVLLKSRSLSLHNTVAVGDAENDSAMLQVAECSVAVQNALDSIKALSDFTTVADHGKGVEEVMDELISTDLTNQDEKLVRHHLRLGTKADGASWLIEPYRPGILLSGVSGCGKTTFAISMAEALVRQNYQFCLIDPEGDYLEFQGAIIIGHDQSLPSMEEIKTLLLNPEQNLVICTLSIPLMDRPAFFAGFMEIFTAMKHEYGHPHWLLLDEAHHLAPEHALINADLLPPDFNNFLLISTSPYYLHKTVLSKVGMIITLGANPTYPLEQFSAKMNIKAPENIPQLAEDELCVWDCTVPESSCFKARYDVPSRLLQRHKRKYANGDMGYNSFIFTGPEARLRLVANNLMMFKHIAEGIDMDTWLFHLRRKDFTRWFSYSLHDEELAGISREVEKSGNVFEGKKKLLAFISRKYAV